MDWSDRYFASDPARRRVARQLYDGIARLPILSPHGHVDPWLLGDPDARFGDPTELFIIPDHYIVRMLYSQGVPIEDLAIPPTARWNATSGRGEPEPAPDHRRVWQRFADHLYLFRATPSGIWFRDALRDVFGVEAALTGANAMAVYDELSAKLAAPEFRPRRLFERFGIETLCTTDDAADSLDAHKAIRASGWQGDVRPTFRPDSLFDLTSPDWLDGLRRLAVAVDDEIDTAIGLVRALERRRGYFREVGAVATDLGVETAHAESLSAAEAGAIFARAVRGAATPDDARRFLGHMLMEMARMSVDDGLVMQLHVGSLRNHNDRQFRKFGPNTGADIPIATEFTRSLRPLLDCFGNDPNFRLVLFTLDESAYSRELAPLAGHYPAVRLGPPWWFHDSLNGMARYFDQVIETAGLYNTAGFNDDTRAFCSIPVRHDVWRRASADWLAGQVVRGIVDEADAVVMAHEMAYALARRTYRLDQPAR